MTALDGSVVLITGANGGLGSHFVSQALDRGAAKVYATARTPRAWDDPRVVALALDVTDPASVRAAADASRDVSVLVNNAGVTSRAKEPSPFADLDAARTVFETNFWGALRVADAWAPALRAHRGALLNVCSVLSWLGIADSYSASKAALWSATNSQRLALAPDGVQVTALHLGYTDTPMTAGIDTEKNDPAGVVRAAYDGLEAGSFEVLADAISVQVKAGLAAPVEALYPQIAAR